MNLVIVKEWKEVTGLSSLSEGDIQNLMDTIGDTPSNHALLDSIFEYPVQFVSMMETLNNKLDPHEIYEITITGHA